MKQGTPEWIEARRAGIGGSDIAAIFGLSPWTSPLAVWHSKVSGQGARENPAMEWGKRLEGAVSARYAEAHPEFTVTGPREMIAHPEHPIALASADGLLLDSEDWNAVGLLEVKTTSQQWSSLPLYYDAQVQWYMGIYDLPFCDVAVLSQGRNYHEHRVEADERWFSVALIRAEKWWQRHIVEGVEPEATAIDKGATFWPAEDESATVEVAEELAHRLASARRRLKEAEEAKDAAEAQLKQAMGSAARATTPEGAKVASWTTTKRMTADVKRLEVEFPNVHQEILRESSSRTFRFSFKEGAA